MAYRNHRTQEDYHEIFCNECGTHGPAKFYESDDEQRWICGECLLELPSDEDEPDEEDEEDEEDAA